MEVFLYVLDIVCFVYDSLEFRKCVVSFFKWICDVCNWIGYYDVLWIFFEFDWFGVFGFILCWFWYIVNSLWWFVEYLLWFVGWIDLVIFLYLC